MSVLDLDEVEAFGVCGGSCGATVTRGEDGGDIEGRDASLAYQKKGSDQVANHVVEESAAANDIDELIAVALKAGFINAADVGGLRLVMVGNLGGDGFDEAKSAVRINGGERREIVLPGNERSGLLHGNFIERIRMVSDVAGKEWRNYVSTPDSIVVGFGAGGVAGVEVVRHFFDRQHANGGGKPVIEHDAKVGGGNAARGLKGGDLREGVDSGIGASGTLREQTLRGETLNGVGERALNCGLAGLDLPSVEGGAVIGESEFESSWRHGRWAVPCRVKGGEFWEQSQWKREVDVRSKWRGVAEG